MLTPFESTGILRHVAIERFSVRVIFDSNFQEEEDFSLRKYDRMALFNSIALKYTSFDYILKYRSLQ